MNHSRSTMRTPRSAARLEQRHRRFHIVRRTVAGIGLIIALTGLPALVEATAAAQAKHFTISLVNGTAVGAPDTIRVKQGDDVELRWSSDKPMDLHLHGYDIEVKVSPAAAAVMSFKAKIPGRFPVEPHGEDHGRHRPVIYLEVLP